MPISQHSRISPPPLKRRKREPPDDTATVTTTSPSSSSSSTNTNAREKRDRGCSSIRIVSWNINGIQPFVQDYLQKTLDSFFKPSSTKKEGEGRKRQRSPGASSGDDERQFSVGNGRFVCATWSALADDKGTYLPKDDPAREGKPSLRRTLQRQQWPEMLFLQEVKIKPGDDKIMNAVRLAVNDPVELDKEEPASLGVLADGGPPYDAHFVLPSDPHNARGFGGKVYGVAAVVRRDFMQQQVECVREPAWDREGRVQIIETRGFGSLEQHSGAGDSSPSREPSLVHGQEVTTEQHRRRPGKLAVINIYAVNGTSNPYRSTHTGAVSGTRHDRKLAVHTELLQEAHALEVRGFSVVIAGDLNVARSSIDGYPNLRTSPHQHVLNRADFNHKFFSSNTLPADSAKVRETRYCLDRLHSNGEGRRGRGEEEEPEKQPLSPAALRGLNAIDTFRHVNGDLRKYSWHSRTREWGTCCDRVDLVLASRSLEDSIAGAGICDNLRGRGPSDHCPVWVDISRNGVSEEEMDT